MNVSETIDEYLIPGTDTDVLERYRTLSDRSREARIDLFEDQVVILDTETTGLDPITDALIQIAAVVMDGPEILDRFETFVDPGRHIPEEVVRLTGITDEQVAGSPDPGTATERLATFVAGRPIIAHNASFDHAFITRAAAPGTFRGIWLDTLALSRIALPRFRTHRLDDLSRAFGAHASTHSAVDDAEALAAVWRILLVALTDLPAGLCTAISELSPDVSWPLRSIFQRVAAASGSADFSLRRCRSERIAAGALPAKGDPIMTGPAPDDDEVKAAFTADGTAGMMYPDYEPRDEQVEMALEVIGAFRTHTFRALEAGTGVGKSMAYLLPAVLTARRCGVTVGVATKTNALMDQLVYNELPRLSRALDGLNYVALKGYEHYPCLRKLERFAADKEEERTVDAIEMTAMLMTWAAQTTWGDLDAVNLHWFGLPRYAIEASSVDCLKNRCPFFPKRCYLRGARQHATSADIVVTNHALLFCDIQADNGILPPIHHWIIDEAHAVETEARRQLSLSVSARELDSLLMRLTSARNGAIATVRRKAAELDGGDLLYAPSADAESRIDTIRPIATSFFSFVKDLADAPGAGASGGYDRMTLWAGPEIRSSAAWGILANTGRSLANKVDDLIKVMRDLMSRMEEFDGEFATQQADLSNATCTLKEMVDALTLILDGEDTSYVYSVELSRKPDDIVESLSAAKIDIGEVLSQDFYPLADSVVFTSATIATGSQKTSFAHFLHGCGLDRMDPASVGTRALASSYDFDRQMGIFLPLGMPEPNTAGYRDAMAQMLLEVHRAMQGSVLTLFTNRREMEDLYSLLRPQLRADGIDLLAQTRGTSAKRLRDAFMADKTLSLFALKSFWEGFDAPGDTLRCVVIPKLPFGRPTDPLAQERNIREDNAWRRYSLPEAIIDLKQAAGRLIRNSKDSGYLVLADGRLQTKHYGKQFLSAMPTGNIRCLPLDEITQHMREGS